MHVGARPRQADRVEADVALHVDHLLTSHLAHRPTTCSLLNLSERRHLCHERLRLVEPILAIYPCAIVPLPAIEVESVDGQQTTLLDQALTLTSLLGFTGPISSQLVPSPEPAEVVSDSAVEPVIGSIASIFFKPAQIHEGIDLRLLRAASG